MASTEPSPPQSSPQQTRAQRSFLIAGTLLGLALALASLVRSDPEELPDGAIGRINDRLVLRDDYEQSLEEYRAALGRELTVEDRQIVIDRIVEEELLAQRGVEVRLPESDPSLRALLVQAMIDVALVDARTEQPTQEAVREFYEEQPERFRRQPQFQVRRIVVPKNLPDAAERAEAAVEALRAGEDFAQVREKYGKRPMLAIPDALLTADKLRDYLGAILAEVLSTMEPGQVSEPTESGSSLHVLQLVRAEQARTPSWEEVRGEARREYQRFREEQAFSEQIQDLRDRAEIVLPDTPP